MMGHYVKLNARANNDPVLCISYFTWDQIRFPNPVEMQHNVSSKGRKMVTVIDPHLKKDKEYQVYSEAKDQGFLMTAFNDAEYSYFCWPGK